MPGGINMRKKRCVCRNKEERDREGEGAAEERKAQHNTRTTESK